MNIYNEESELAISLVKKAHKIPEWFKEKGFKSFEKRDQSPVTLADLATQIYIVDNLRAKFPEDHILAEEEGSLIDINSEKLIYECFDDLKIKVGEIKETINYRGRFSKREWTVDPIDGTQGYVEGLSYAVGIGLMVESDPKISAISVPNYNEEGLGVFSAVKNIGVYASYGGKEFKEIKVSNQDSLKDAVLCHSLHYDKPWVLEFAKKVGINKLIRIDSMLKFCKIADGSADLYIKPIDRKHSFSWDFLPGYLIVTEAGGKVTDSSNRPIWFKSDTLMWSEPAVIASNGVIHDKVIDHLKKLQS
ncbi:MAG: 3'(2'),5'-bisphosphate nucleotidase CysQ [Promethearchaeota archaeon]